MKKLNLAGFLILILCMSCTAAPKKTITLKEVPLNGYFCMYEAKDVLEIEGDTFEFKYVEGNKISIDITVKAKKDFPKLTNGRVEYCYMLLYGADDEPIITMTDDELIPEITNSEVLLEMMDGFKAGETKVLNFKDLIFNEVSILDKIVRFEIEIMVYGDE